MGWTDDEDLEQLRMMMMGWDAPVYMDNFEINMILMGTWIGLEGRKWMLEKERTRRIFFFLFGTACC